MKTDFQELAGPGPDLMDLNAEFKWAVDQRDSNVLTRQRENYENRNCIWPGQTRDGRRWKPVGLEEEVFPWPGRSDARMGLIDLYVNQDVALAMVTLERMRTRVYGTEVNDEAFANRLTQVLRWMKYTQISEFWREARLAGNYLYERGSAVIMPHWCYAEQLGYETIDMETLMGQAMEGAQQGNELVAALPEMILDESLEEEVVQLAQRFYPDVSKADLLQAVRELRTTGTAQLVRPYVLKNRVSLCALCPNEDFFMSPDAADIESARLCSWVEAVSETTLRERVRGYDWKKSWVEQVIETQRGVFTTPREERRSRALWFSGNKDKTKLFEIVHAYRRLADKKGVPGIYYTVYNPGVLSKDEDLCADHGLLDYDHGEKPFILIEREKRSRLSDSSRGYGEIGGTWQAQIKTQWDSRTDRTSLATMPPLLHPVGQPPTKWGPGVKQGVRSRDQYGYADAPKYDGGSKEIEETVRKFSDQYFGRPTDEFDGVLAGIMQQDRINCWMQGWKSVDAQILKLMQQRMPDEFYYRVVGSNKGQSIHASREEIQGSFDISVSYNVQDLDPEHVEKRLGLMERMLALDPGSIDRQEALQVMADLVDPNLGERLLQPGEAASQKEIEDEQTVVAKLAQGIDVDIKPGQAYELRMKVLNNTVQMSQPIQKLLQDPEIMKLFEKRSKQLQFQIEQKTVNPKIGRLLGTQPAQSPV